MSTAEGFRAPKGAGTIFESGGRYHWRRKATDSGGKTVSWIAGVFDTREAAELAQAGATAPVSVDWQVRTWGSWLDEYVPRRLSTLRASNQGSYASILQRHYGHLRNQLADLRMVATTPADLTEAFGAIVRGGCKPTYVQRMRSSLGTAWRAAQATGMPVPGNPVALSSVPKLSRRAREGRVREVDLSEALTPDEWRLVRGVMADLIANGPNRRTRVTHWALPTIVAGGTGARRGEALGFQVNDLDMERRLLRFDRQVVFDNETGRLKLDELKTEHAYRTVTIGRSLTEMLADHIERHSLSGEDLLFTTSDGGLLHPDSFTSWITRQFRLAGIAKHCSPHTLRHTHVTILLRDNVSDVDVARRIGHGSSSFTRDRYVRFLGDPDDGIGDRFDRLIGE